MHAFFPGSDGSPRALRAVANSLVLACALLVLGTPATAQDVRLGVRAGPTFGFLNDSALPFVSAGGDATANTNVRLDGHAGLFAVVPVGGSFGLQTELLYVRKGAHFSRRGDADYRVEQYQLGYLQGAVLGRRDSGLPGPLHLHAVGGFTLERLLHGTADREIQTVLAVFRETVDLAGRDLVRRWDVGLLFGMGVGYALGEAGRLTLEVRYNRGLRSIFTSATRSPSERSVTFGEPPPLTRTPPSLHHDVITASLAYTLPLLPEPE